METLFESYMQHWLAARLLPGHLLRAKQGDRYLAKLVLKSEAGSEAEPSARRGFFRLEPDLSIWRDSRCMAILDTKWKRLNDGPTRKSYGLSNADVYQIFAYGRRYIEDRGELVLIYPRAADFREPVGPFDFEDGRRLWLLPFDLLEDRLILPETLRPEDAGFRAGRA